MSESSWKKRKALHSKALQMPARFHASQVIFYVGSTYQRKIVSVDRKGAVRDFTGEAQEGPLGVVGMKVDTKRGDSCGRQLFRSLYKPAGAYDRAKLLDVVVLRARL